ncbi:hypothetical protein B0T16DRAFT_460668 [Cercophora newfieldiana]|uniref:Uncharacterized protein n=1 Tax=Cercophora newfieldiana TaxID=92897 RepID=A0AA39Y3B9_9PEZI|nr:hypothetical protein B0T16DRAFT_460668 [Cercophora newfieldiana]
MAGDSNNLPRPPADFGRSWRVDERVQPWHVAKFRRSLTRAMYRWYEENPQLFRQLEAILQHKNFKDVNRIVALNYPLIEAYSELKRLPRIGLVLYIKQLLQNEDPGKSIRMIIHTPEGEWGGIDDGMADALEDLGLVFKQEFEGPRSVLGDVGQGSVVIALSDTQEYLNRIFQEDGDPAAVIGREFHLAHDNYFVGEIDSGNVPGRGPGVNRGLAVFVSTLVKNHTDRDPPPELPAELPSLQQLMLEWGREAAGRGERLDLEDDMVDDFFVAHGPFDPR